MSEVINNRRLAKNTLFLYIRMIILMLVNLYTSRIVLDALGVDDYGVYNVVGGFISMFSIISGSLSTAISRYLMFSLGKDNIEKLRNIFSTSIIIQLSLGLIIILLAESIGVWFLNNKMQIPASSMTAANWVLQFSLITFLFNLLNVPYNAAIVAHERMKAFAYIGLIEGFANLGVAFVVLKSASNHLEVYSGLMCLVAVAIRIIYGVYCKRNFAECSFKFIFDKNQIKEMFGFAGWNFIGSASGLLRSQGLNILFNLFNGAAVNAARGLSVQVETAVVKFSSSFYTAVQPQITKGVASNQKMEACQLACRSSRLAFLLLCVLSLPIIFNANFILHIWLTEVPEYTAQFVQVILIYGMIESFSQPLIQLMLANGDIKKYQIIVGSIVLANFPVAWGLLALGISPVNVQASIIIFSILALIFRVYMLNRMIDFPSRLFYYGTVLRCIFILSCVSVICIFFKIYFAEDFLGFVLFSVLIEVILGIMIILFGLDKSERSFIIALLRKYRLLLSKH